MSQIETPDVDGGGGSQQDAGNMDMATNVPCFQTENKVSWHNVARLSTPSVRSCFGVRLYQQNIPAFDTPLV